MIKCQFQRPMYSYATTINPAELDEYLKKLERIRDLLIEIGSLQKNLSGNDKNIRCNV